MDQRWHDDILGGVPLPMVFIGADDRVRAVNAAAFAATAAIARDHVQVAGSSTVLPYATIVAGAFGENFDFPTPVIESGGPSAGLRRFCEASAIPPLISPMPRAPPRTAKSPNVPQAASPTSSRCGSAMTE